ncbi:hypothetical protein CDAR_574051 [Caerostris darwini]|uniref:Uncharacterized protein n=1 Tax=Caerostris darwini TaxID=1538125 RepID=A0AAV4T4N5_9ARAC|nr:hypothetical protein CDAR_574051 [Caerostris darwini]
MERRSAISISDSKAENTSGGIKAHPPKISATPIRCLRDPARDYSSRNVWGRLALYRQMGDLKSLFYDLLNRKIALHTFDCQCFLNR